MTFREFEGEKIQYRNNRGTLIIETNSRYIGLTFPIVDLGAHHRHEGLIQFSKGVTHLP
jgi:hypothetical protein